MPEERRQKRRPTDSLWLVASFAMLALSGVGMNLIIAAGYGSAALGLFNLTLAVYIFASQFAVFGMQYAALYYVSINADNDDGKYAAGAALLSGMICSCLAVYVVYAARDALAVLMNTPELADSLAFAAVGLCFFSANKIFMNILNAHNHIKQYALGNFARYGGLVLSVLAMTLSACPVWSLAASLPCGELCAAVWLYLNTRRYVAWRMPWGSLTLWSRKVCSYGARASAVGVIAELNTRVDILILGCFASNAVVGLYSFVALLAEGLGQLPLLGRIYNDPLIARLWAAQRLDELHRLIRRTRFIGWAGMGAMCLLAYFLYEPLLVFLPNGAEYMEATPVFGILLLGVTISAGYVPLSGMLQQTGCPGWQSLQVICVFLINAVGNLTLVPFWGIHGAAIGLSLSQIGMICILRILVRRTIQFSL